MRKVVLVSVAMVLLVAVTSFLTMFFTMGLYWVNSFSRIFAVDIPLSHTDGTASAAVNLLLPKGVYLFTARFVGTDTEVLSSEDQLTLNCRFTQNGSVSTSEYQIDGTMTDNSKFYHMKLPEDWVGSFFPDPEHWGASIFPAPGSSLGMLGMEDAWFLMDLPVLNKHELLTIEIESYATGPNAGAGVWHVRLERSNRDRGVGAEKYQERFRAAGPGGTERAPTHTPME